MCRRAWSSDAKKAVLLRCSDLHSSVVAPLNLALRGPLDVREEQLFQTALPFVLLLGNHSSGKSSFANYCLGRVIQTAGVAPTDDAFTIIAPGPADHDRDGPALVSDPDLGFQGMRSFGPNLIQHTQLKIRSGLATTSFMMVDSPGMIDSPGGTTGDRGYNFDGAVRWLAERADVILLFFDPDKPGTTGETLATLTNALAGTDHKLHIVLNKADRFERIHDFARAYGALCWNLSKVIPRKDLPRIYTMCLPTDRTKGGLGLDDLDRSREEVVHHVFDAPNRRVDNAITRLRDSAATLMVHAKVSNAARAKARWAKVSLYTTTAAAALTVASATGAAAALAAPAALIIGVPCLGAPAVALLHMLHARTVISSLRVHSAPEALDALFRQTHHPLQDDDDTLALWQVKVKPHLLALLRDLQFDASTLPGHSGALLMLSRILETDVPDLRRASAPVDFKQARKIGSLFVAAPSLQATAHADAQHAIVGAHDTQRTSTSS